jgi:hypothetical protein
MYVPWWVFAVVAAFKAVAWGRRRWLRRVSIDTVRSLWGRLPRRRKEEVLYVRDRIDRSGPVGVLDYDGLTDDELQQRFDNSLRNALDGEPWAFDLLQEQVCRHSFGTEPPWSTPATRRALASRSDAEDTASASQRR